MTMKREWRKITASLLALVMIISSLPLNLIAYAEGEQSVPGIGVINTAYVQDEAVSYNTYQVKLYTVDPQTKVKTPVAVPSIADITNFTMDAGNKAGRFTLANGGQVNLLSSTSFCNYLKIHNVDLVEISFLESEDTSNPTSYKMYSSDKGERADYKTETVGEETQTDNKTVIYTILKEVEKKDANGKTVVETVYDEYGDPIGFRPVMEPHALDSSDYSLSSFVSTELIEHEVNVYWHDTGSGRPDSLEFSVTGGTATYTTPTIDSPVSENSNYDIYKYSVPYKDAQGNEITYSSTITTNVNQNDYRVVDNGSNNKFTFYGLTTFDFTIDWHQGENHPVTNTDEQIKTYLDTYFDLYDETETELDAQGNPVLDDQGNPKPKKLTIDWNDITITRLTDSTTGQPTGSVKISIPKLDEITSDGRAKAYFVQKKTSDNIPINNDDSWKVTAENSGIHSSDISRVYQDGTISNVISGKINFSANVEWNDGANEDKREKKDDPGNVVLWRYADVNGKNEAENKERSAQCAVSPLVKTDDNGNVYYMIGDVEVIGIKDGQGNITYKNSDGTDFSGDTTGAKVKYLDKVTFDQLEKYDRFGNPYVYYAKEVLDGGVGNYNVSYSNTNSKTDGAYDGGKITNNLAGTRNFVVEAEWKAAARQGGTATVKYKVQKAIKNDQGEITGWEDVGTPLMDEDGNYLKKTGGTDENPVYTIVETAEEADTVSELILDNFKAETMKQTGRFGPLPQYDADGNEITYRVVQFYSKRTDGSNTNSHNDIVDGQATQTFNNNKDEYEITVAKQGSDKYNFTYLLTGNMDVKIVKEWNDSNFKSYHPSNNLPDHSNDTIQAQVKQYDFEQKKYETFTVPTDSGAEGYIEENASHFVSAGENGKDSYFKIVSTDNQSVVDTTQTWYITLKVPMYDSEGHEYQYDVTELNRGFGKSGTDSSTGIEYSGSYTMTMSFTAKNGNDPDTYKITNTYTEGPGYEILISKEWKDDGDLLHRKPVTITCDSSVGSSVNPTLSDTNTWQTYVGKNENYVYNSDHFTESSSRYISGTNSTSYTIIATKANNYDQKITFHNLDQGTYRLRQKNGYEQPTTVNGEKVYEPRWENVETDKSPTNGSISFDLTRRTKIVLEKQDTSDANKWDAVTDLSTSNTGKYISLSNYASGTTSSCTVDTTTGYITLNYSGQQTYALKSDNTKPTGYEWINQVLTTNYSGQSNTTDLQNRNLVRFPDLVAVYQDGDHYYAVEQTNSGDGSVKFTNTRIGVVTYEVDLDWCMGGWEASDAQNKTFKVSISGKINGVDTSYDQLINVSAEQHSYFLTNLPKYDSQGKIIDWEISEIELAGQTITNGTCTVNGKRCRTTVTDTTYTYGTVSHSDDLIRVKITNRFEGTTDAKVNKMWFDDNNALGLRGDTYIQLWYRSTAPGTPEWTQLGGDYVWTATQDTEWHYTFSDLPEFDSKGYPYEYAIRELSVADYSTSMYDGSYSPATDTGTASTLTDNKVPNGGWFVDRLSGNVVVDGKKLWNNISTVLAKSHYPIAKIELYRENKYRKIITVDINEFRQVTSDPAKYTAAETITGLPAGTYKAVAVSSGITVSPANETTVPANGSITVTLTSDTEVTEAKDFKLLYKENNVWTDYHVLSTDDETFKIGETSIYSGDSKFIFKKAESNSINTHAHEIEDGYYVIKNGSVPDTKNLGTVAAPIYSMVLPKFDENGALITYTLKEVPINGYAFEISNDKIVNEFKGGRPIEIRVTKNWGNMHNVEYPAVKLILHQIMFAKTMNEQGTDFVKDSNNEYVLTPIEYATFEKVLKRGDGNNWTYVFGENVIDASNIVIDKSKFVKDAQQANTYTATVTVTGLPAGTYRATPDINMTVTPDSTTTVNDNGEITFTVTVNKAELNDKEKFRIKRAVNEEWQNSTVISIAQNNFSQNTDSSETRYASVTVQNLSAGIYKVVAENGMTVSPSVLNVESNNTSQTFSVSINRAPSDTETFTLQKLTNVAALEWGNITDQNVKARFNNEAEAVEALEVLSHRKNSKEDIRQFAPDGSVFTYYVTEELINSDGESVQLNAIGTDNSDTHNYLGTGLSQDHEAKIIAGLDVYSKTSNSWVRKKAVEQYPDQMPEGKTKNDYILIEDSGLGFRLTELVQPDAITEAYTELKKQLPITRNATLKNSYEPELNNFNGKLIVNKTWNNHDDQNGNARNTDDFGNFKDYSFEVSRQTKNIDEQKLFTIKTSSANQVPEVKFEKTDNDNQYVHELYSVGDEKVLIKEETQMTAHYAGNDSQTIEYYEQELNFVKKYNSNTEEDFTVPVTIKVYKGDKTSADYNKVEISGLAIYAQDALRYFYKINEIMTEDEFKAYKNNDNPQSGKMQDYDENGVLVTGDEAVAETKKEFTLDNELKVFDLHLYKVFGKKYTPEGSSEPITVKLDPADYHQYFNEAFVTNNENVKFKIWRKKSNQGDNEYQEYHYGGNEWQTVSGSGNPNNRVFSITFNNLPKYSPDGNPYVYKITEKSAPEGSHYIIRYNTSDNVNSDQESAIGISCDDNHGSMNTYVRNVFEAKQIDVNKYWDDNDNADGMRPSSVHVTINEVIPAFSSLNGQEETFVRVLEEGLIEENKKWTKKVELPKYYYNGSTPVPGLKYGIAETTDELFAKGYNDPTYTYMISENGFLETKKLSTNESISVSKTEDGQTIELEALNVYNSKDPINSKLTFDKQWDDKNNEWELRPDHIYVKLTRDTKDIIEINPRKDTFNIPGSMAVLESEATGKYNMTVTIRNLDSTAALNYKVQQMGVNGWDDINFTCDDEPGNTGVAYIKFTVNDVDTSMIQMFKIVNTAAENSPAVHVDRDGKPLVAIVNDSVLHDVVKTDNSGYTAGAKETTALTVDSSGNISVPKEKAIDEKAGVLVTGLDKYSTTPYSYKVEKSDDVSFNTSTANTDFLKNDTGTNQVSLSVKADSGNNSNSLYIRVKRSVEGGAEETVTGGYQISGANPDSSSGGIVVTANEKVTISGLPKNNNENPAKPYTYKIYVSENSNFSDEAELDSTVTANNTTVTISATPVHFVYLKLSYKDGSTDKYVTSGFTVIGGRILENGVIRVQSGEPAVIEGLSKNMPYEYKVYDGGTALSSGVEVRDTTDKEKVDVLALLDNVTDNKTLTIMRSVNGGTDELVTDVTAYRFFAVDRTTGVVALPASQGKSGDENENNPNELFENLSYGVVNTDGSWKPYYYTTVECDKYGNDADSKLKSTQTDKKADGDQTKETSINLNFQIDVSGYSDRKHINIKIMRGNDIVKTDINGNPLKITVDGAEYYASDRTDNTPAKGVIVIPVSTTDTYINCTVHDLPYAPESSGGYDTPFDYTVKRCKANGNDHSENNGELPLKDMSDSNSGKYYDKPTNTTPAKTTLTYEKTWTKYAVDEGLKPEEIHLKLCRTYTAADGTKVTEEVTEYNNQLNTIDVSTANNNDDPKTYVFAGSIDDLPAGKVINKDDVGIWRRYNYFFKEYYDSAYTEEKPGSTTYGQFEQTKGEDKPFVLTSNGNNMVAELAEGIKNTLTTTSHAVNKTWKDQDAESTKNRSDYYLVLERRAGIEGAWEKVDLNYTAPWYIDSQNNNKVDMTDHIETAGSGESSYTRLRVEEEKLNIRFDELPYCDEKGAVYQYRVAEVGIGSNDVINNKTYFFLVPGTEPTDEDYSYVRIIRRGTSNYYVNYNYDSEKTNCELEDYDYSKYDTVATEIENTIVTNSVSFSHISVTKTWNDEDNVYGKRPEEVKFRLTRTKDGELDGGFKSDKSANEANDWKCDWSQLAAFAADGGRFEYFVDELPVAYYHTDPPVETSETVNGETTKKLTYTNTYIPQKKTITAEKLWDDQSDIYGLRPKNVTYELYCKYKKYTSTVENGVQTLTEAGTYNGAVYTAGADDADQSEVYKEIKYAKEHKSIPETVSENDFVKTLSSAQGDSSDSNKWKIDFGELPAWINPTGDSRYNGKAVEVTYYIVETFTNAETDVKYKKVYNCEASNKYGSATDKIPGTSTDNFVLEKGLLYSESYSTTEKSGKQVYAVPTSIADENGKINVLIRNLDAGDTNGNRYSYDIVETNENGNTVTTSHGITRSDSPASPFISSDGKITGKQMNDKLDLLVTADISADDPKPEYIYFTVTRTKEENNSGFVKELDRAANGTAFTVNGSNTISYTPSSAGRSIAFTALPGSGETDPYGYTVKEYDSNGAVVENSNMTITAAANTSDSTKVDITVTKSGAAAGTPLYFRISRSRTEVTPKELLGTSYDLHNDIFSYTWTESGNNSVTIQDLPARDAKNNLYTYEAVEYDGDAKDAVEVTNLGDDKKISWLQSNESGGKVNVTVKKPSNNPFGSNGQTVYFKLRRKATNVTTDYVTTAANRLVVKPINYTLTSSDGNPTILKAEQNVSSSITNTLNTRDIIVRKEWNDNQYAEGRKLHYDIDVTLSSTQFNCTTAGRSDGTHYSETKAIPKDYDENNPNKPSTDFANAVIFRGLPKYKSDGTLIDYAVTETVAAVTGSGSSATLEHQAVAGDLVIESGTEPSLTYTVPNSDPAQTSTLSVTSNSSSTDLTLDVNDSKYGYTGTWESYKSSAESADDAVVRFKLTNELPVVKFEGHLYWNDGRNRDGKRLNDADIVLSRDNWNYATEKTITPETDNDYIYFSVPANGVEWTESTVNMSKIRMYISKSTGTDEPEEVNPIGGFADSSGNHIYRFPAPSEEYDTVSFKGTYTVTEGENETTVVKQTVDISLESTDPDPVDYRKGYKFTPSSVISSGENDGKYNCSPSSIGTTSQSFTSKGYAIEIDLTDTSLSGEKWDDPHIIFKDSSNAVIGSASYVLVPGNERGKYLIHVPENANTFVLTNGSSNVTLSVEATSLTAGRKYILKKTEDTANAGQYVYNFDSNKISDAARAEFITNISVKNLDVDDAENGEYWAADFGLQPVCNENNQPYTYRISEKDDTKSDTTSPVKTTVRLENVDYTYDYSPSVTMTNGAREPTIHKKPTSGTDDSENWKLENELTNDSQVKTTYIAAQEAVPASGDTPAKDAVPATVTMVVRNNYSPPDPDPGPDPSPDPPSPVYETGTIKLTKAWSGDDNCYQYSRPASMNFTLKCKYQSTDGSINFNDVVTNSDVIAIKSLTSSYSVFKSNGWKLDITGLPKYINPTGTAVTPGEVLTVTYYLVETEHPGYTKSGDGVDLDITSGEASTTVTNTLKTASVKVKKTWVDHDYTDTHYDVDSTLTLGYNAHTWTVPTITNGDTADQTVSNLPVYTADGNLAQYNVTETTKKYGYVPTYSDSNFTLTENSTKEVTITNTLPVTDLIVNKKWSDSNNTYKLRPSDISLTVGRATASDESNWEDITSVSQITRNRTVTNQNAWSITYSNLLQYAENGDPYLFQVTETVPHGYKTSAATVTTTKTEGVVNYNVSLTNELITGTLTVYKNWDDQSVTDVTHYNETVKAESTTNVTSDNQKITFANNDINSSSGSGQSVTISNVPVFDMNGQNISYVVTETSNQQYGYYLTTSQAERTNTLTETSSGSGTYTGEVTLTNKLPKTDITVTKTWNDFDNKYGLRPASVKFNLYRTSGDADVSSDSGWEEVTINQEVTSTASWSYTFQNLLKFDQSGNEYRYKVKEVYADGVMAYSELAPQATTVQGDSHKTENSNFPLTFANVLDTRDINVTKSWDDNGYGGDAGNDTAKALHYNVQVTLSSTGFQWNNANYTDSKIIASKDNNGYGITFTGLPKYDQNGDVIAYTLAEAVTTSNATESVSASNITNGTAVGNGVFSVTSKENGYVGSCKQITDSDTGINKNYVTQFNILNTLPVSKFIANKTWNDDKNRDGKRPVEVEFTLTRDGDNSFSEISKALSSTWSTNFDNKVFPTYKTDNSAYSYTITETAIDDYSSSKTEGTATTENNVTSRTDSFTNTYTSQKRNLTLEKKWVDAVKTTINGVEKYVDYSSWTRPSDIKVRLKFSYNNNDAKYYSELTDKEKAALNLKTEYTGDISIDQDKTLDSGKTWTEVLTDLPEKINPDGTERVNGTSYPLTYSIEEYTHGGYTEEYSSNVTLDADGKKLTVTNTLKTEDIKVYKEWSDKKLSDNTQDYDGTDYSHFNITGKITSSDIQSTDLNNKEFTINVPVDNRGSNAVSYAEIKGVPIYKNKASDNTAEQAHYTIEELNTIGGTYNMKYGYEVQTGKFENFVLDTNGTAVKEFTFSNKLPLTAVNVEKTWDDDFSDTQNYYSLRPSSITLKLYRTTTASLGRNAQSGWTHVKDYSLSGEGNVEKWSYTFNDLLKFDENSNQYYYKIEEENVKGYSTAYTQQTATGPVGESNSTDLGLTNTLITGKVKVIKHWDDQGYTAENLHYKIKTDIESVTDVTSNSQKIIIADNEIASDVSANDQCVIINDVPVFDMNGTAITYNVTETTSQRYGYTLTGNDHTVTLQKQPVGAEEIYYDEETLTNQLPVTYLKVQKNWDVNTTYHKYVGTYTDEQSQTHDYRDIKFDLTRSVSGGSDDAVSSNVAVAYADSPGMYWTNSSPLLVYDQQNRPYTYKVQEQQLKGYTPSYSYTYTDTTTDPSTSVTTANGTIPAETAVSGSPLTLTLMNTQITGDAKLQKIDYTYYDRHKTDARYTDIGLNNAEFELYIKNGNNEVKVPVTKTEDTEHSGHYYYQFNASLVTEGWDSDAHKENYTVVSDALDSTTNGIIDIRGLPLNTYYLKEKTKLNGFELNTKEYCFVVDVNGSNEVTKYFSTSPATPASVNRTESEKTIYNNDGFIDHDTDLPKIGNVETPRTLKLIKEDAEDSTIKLKNATYYLLYLKPYDLNGTGYDNESAYKNAAVTAVKSSGGQYTSGDTGVEHFWTIEDTIQTDSSGIYQTEVVNLSGGLDHGVYTLLEVQAPVGYKINNSGFSKVTYTVVDSTTNAESQVDDTTSSPILITLDREHTDCTITHEDPRKNAKVDIYKQDKFENPLNGAEFELYFVPDRYEGQIYHQSNEDSDFNYIFFTNNTHFDPDGDGPEQATLPQEGAWDKVYAYFFNSNGDVDGAFPGTEQTLYWINDDGDKVYKVIPPDGATGVVFNNNAEKKTEDIKFTLGNGYYKTSKLTDNSVDVYNVNYNGGDSADPDKIWSHAQYVDGQTVTNTQYNTYGECVYIKNDAALIGMGQAWDDLHIYFMNDDDQIVGQKAPGYSPTVTATINTISTYKVEIPVGATKFVLNNGNKSGGHARSTVTVPIEPNAGYSITDEKEGDNYKVKLWGRNLDTQTPITNLNEDPQQFAWTTPIKIATVITGDNGLTESVKIINPSTGLQTESNTATEYAEVSGNKVVVRKWGTYFWKEVQGPTGYTANDETLKPFDIGANEADKVVNVINADNTPIKGTVTLTKTAQEKVGDYNIGAPVPGAVFNLYKKSGDNWVRVPIDGAQNTGYTVSTGTNYNMTTGSPDGKITISELDWGQYYLVETSAPAGFKVDSDKKLYFSVGRNNYEGQELSFKNVSQTAKLTINKTIDARKDAWSNPTFIFKIKQTHEKLGDGQPQGLATPREKIVSLTLESGCGTNNDGLNKSTGEIEIEPGTYEITEVSVSRYKFHSCTVRLSSGNTATIDNGKATFTVGANETAIVDYVNHLEYYDKFSQVDCTVNHFDESYKGIRVEYTEPISANKPNDKAEIDKKANDFKVYKIMSSGKEVEVTDADYKKALTLSYTPASSTKDDTRFSTDFSDDTANGKFTVENVSRYTDGVYTLTATDANNFTCKFDISFVSKNGQTKEYQKSVVFKADTDNKSYFTDGGVTTSQYELIFTIVESSTPGTYEVYNVKHNGEVIASGDAVASAVNSCINNLTAGDTPILTVNEAFASSGWVFDQWNDGTNDIASLDYNTFKHDVVDYSKKNDAIIYTAKLKTNPTP